jgi:hypothetical protein
MYFLRHMYFTRSLQAVIIKQEMNVSYKENACFGKFVADYAMFSRNL